MKYVYIQAMVSLVDILMLLVQKWLLNGTVFQISNTSYSWISSKVNKQIKASLPRLSHHPRPHPKA